MINLNRMIKLASIMLVAILVMNLFSFICSADNTDRKRIVVSLGDSYSSGEGIEPFYGQNNDMSIKITDPDWLAHRSEHAWSGQLSIPDVGLLSDHRDENWFFVASSGAETKHLINPQKKEYSTDISSNYETYIPAQLEVLDKLDGQDPDYITLTLGGNDIGFVDTLMDAASLQTYIDPCYLPDKLTLAMEKVREGGKVREDIKQAYYNIRYALTVPEPSEPQTNIIVVGYPKLFDPDGGMCGVFSQTEARMINSCVSYFNNVIEELVYECANDDIVKMNIYYVSVEEAFDGHGAYSTDAYINGVILGSQSEDLKKFQIVSAYSMHPNEKGARAYADCVQAKIDEIEAKTINGSSHASDIVDKVSKSSLEGSWSPDINATEPEMEIIEFYYSTTNQNAEVLNYEHYHRSGDIEKYYSSGYANDETIDNTCYCFPYHKVEFTYFKFDLSSVESGVIYDKANGKAFYKISDKRISETNNLSLEYETVNFNGCRAELEESIDEWFGDNGGMLIEGNRIWVTGYDYDYYAFTRGEYDGNASYDYDSYKRTAQQSADFLYSYAQREVSDCRVIFIVTGGYNYEETLFVFINGVLVYDYKTDSVLDCTWG